MVIIAESEGRHFLSYVGKSMRSLRDDGHPNLHTKLRWIEKCKALKINNKSDYDFIVVLQIIKAGNLTLDLARKQV